MSQKEYRKSSKEDFAENFVFKYQSKDNYKTCDHINYRIHSIEIVCCMRNSIIKWTISDAIIFSVVFNFSESLLKVEPNHKNIV